MDFNPKYLKQNLLDYLMLLLLLGSYAFLKKNPVTGHEFWYFAAFIFFVFFKVHAKGFISLFKLSLGEGKKGIAKFILSLIVIIVISNILLSAIQAYVFKESFELKKSFDTEYLSLFLIIKPVRIFGEEIIFRGLLLNKYIKSNKWAFWITNVMQAALFAYIHSLFTEDISSKIIFGAYAFVFSVFGGWLNNKYNSLLPSILMHWGNGIQEFFFLF